MNTTLANTNVLNQQQKIIEQTNQQTCQNIINSIIEYSDRNGKLLTKYSQQFFLQYFDKTVINGAINKFNINNQYSMTIQQFIRMFLNIITHSNQETLYLAMSLKKLYIKIKQNVNNQSGVKFSDFTNYLCEKITNNDFNLVIPMKQVPKQKFVPDLDKVRQIDMLPTIVIKNGQQDLPKIAKDKKKKDKRPLQRKAIAQLIFNPQKQEIITVGRLSSSIYFYNLDLKKTKQITPKTYKDMAHDIAILSIAFDNSYQRIGAIINGIGIAFWQGADNFQSQKTISKYHGDKIYFLSLFKQWVTTDKTTVYFWDIKEQVAKNKITYDDSIFINDICQINHLRCICVSYTAKDDKKVFIVYKNMKPILKYDLGSVGCHTLHYNIATQTMISAGYHNHIQVFEVENKTFSVNLKKQLRGHSSIVNCLNDIKNSNYIVSGDDSGQVRIWDLNFMKCIQVVRISKWIGHLCCTGEKLIFTDSRLNVIEMQKFKTNTSDDNEIINGCFNDQVQGQFIVTRKSIRYLNINNGKIQSIFNLCDDDEEISSFVQISSGLLVGTSKGKMKLYAHDGQKKWIINAHEGQITQLKYDRKSRFIFSLASDNKLYIWPQKQIQEQGYRKMISFRAKQFNSLLLFDQVRILILGSSQQNQLVFWDYENWKLMTVITLNSPINVMEFNAFYRILMIGSVNDSLYLIKINWSKSNLNFQIMYRGDSKIQLLKSKKQLQLGEKLSNNQLKCLDKCSQSNINDFLITETNIKIIKNQKQTEFNQKMSSRILKDTNKNQTIKKKFKKKTNTNQFEQKQKQMQSKNKTVIFNGKSQIDDDSVSVSKKKNCSIKFIITPQQSIKIQGSKQNKIKTFQSLKKIDSEIISKIQIKETQFGVYLLICNTKGEVKCYKIDQLIEKHYPKKQKLEIKRQSATLYRPSKQQYENEVEKNKHQNLHISKIPNKTSQINNYCFDFLWQFAFTTKQAISCLSFIDMKNVYTSVGTSDGYYKIFNLQDGKLFGSLKMNLPLPMIWDMKIEKDLFIKKNVYETLMILDRILSNNGYSMLSKQYKAVNITKFLEIISSLNQNQQINQEKINSKKQVHLLHEEYTIEDLKGIKPKQNTIKQLQAYKRVKLIKEKTSQGSQKYEQKASQIEKNQKQIVQFSHKKEDVQKLLCPNYFPALKDQGSLGQLKRTMDASSLENRSIILIQKVKMKKKFGLDFMNENDQIKKQKTKKQLSFELPSINFVPNVNNKSQIEKDENKQNYQSMILGINSLQNSAIKSNQILLIPSLTQSRRQDKKIRSHMTSKRATFDDKPIKQILNEIDQKLNKYKKQSYGRRSIV